MKNTLVLFACLVVVSFSTRAQGVSIGTATPHSSALLDLSSTNKGVLTPRMNSSQRMAIATPAGGLLVYDTDTKSFWFYNGTAWANLASAATGGWGLSGNSGINSSSNFIGTTDKQNLQFRVNNRLHGKLDTLGNIFLGDSAGSKILGFTGNIAMGTAALKNNGGASQLVAIGDSALARSSSGIGQFDTYGYEVTAIGTETLKTNRGSGNTAVGFKALTKNTSGSYNTGIGAYTLYYNTEGGFNTSVGVNALSYNIDGHFNTVTGANALAFNTTGAGNSAVGCFSLGSNTTGHGNVAVGLNALYTNETGGANVAIGTYALHKTTGQSNLVAIGDSALYNNGQNLSLPGDATRNTAVGSKSLFANTRGFDNTALGWRTLYSNTSGDNNVAIGRQTMQLNTTGYSNTAVGSASLPKNTGGYQNTAVGFAAMLTNVTGNQNLAVGVSALLSNATGNNNSSLGNNSLENNSTGSGNVAVGNTALNTNSTGSNNTAIGFGADVSTAALTNAMALGYNATVNASNKIRLGNSSVTVIEGQVSYTTSDGRFKKNIQDNVPGLEFITSLKPLTYQYRSYEMERFMNQQNTEKQKALKETDFREAESMVHMGFIAQDVEKIINEKGYGLSLVHTPANANDNYSIAYGELVAPLVKAVQEQQSMINAQQQIIEDLQKRLSALEKKK